MGKSKRVIVVSLDALGSTDFDTVRKLPHFRRFLKHAAFSRQVQSVYPSLTYPAHTTIVTGRTPAHHGVVNNTLLQPERRSPDWCWQRKYVSGTTLYDEALAGGLKVAALLWPVTAKSDITYNVPEIFANRPWSNQILTSLANGTPGYQWILNQKFGRLRDGKKQPALDNFTHASLKYTLRNYRPDLTLVHLTDLDSQRHEYGFDSPEAQAAIRRHDQRIGELMSVMKYCGMDIARDTTLILLGDHSQMDTGSVILLNKTFREHGFLQAQNGVIRDWKVICKNCDGSAYIYIRNDGMDSEERTRLKNEVYDLLKVMKLDPDNGIAAIYPRKKAEAMGADPNCTFMLEARRGFYFQDELDINQIAEIQRATHGYHPNRKDYQTVFMIAGPDIQPGVDIGEMSLIDEGPTIAAVMGLKLPAADGRVLDEIFKASL